MQLDLNLLTALDMLLEEGSVAGAAFRLNLSAPAMSRTLGRIRSATGDMILVRTGRTMVPTPHALALRSEVHTLVRQAQALLAPEQDLVLSTLERTFTLQCHDAVTTAMGSALLAALEQYAPRAALRILAEAPTDTHDLRHGNIDLEISSSEPSLPEIHFETLGHDQLVVVVRPEHPLSNGKLTLERYAQARHITVSRRGRLHDPIDEILAVHGLRRRVVASAPTSTAALHFVQQSDLVVVVPQHLCPVTFSTLGLFVLPLPFEVPKVALNQAWHCRFDTDKAHMWLRGQVRKALEAIFR